MIILLVRLHCTLTWFGIYLLLVRLPAMSMLIFISAFTVANSQVTIGIAGPDIEDDIPPGQWNGTVGYSSSGQCYSSHKSQANTTGQKFTEGEYIGSHHSNMRVMTLMVDGS